MFQDKYVRFNGTHESNSGIVSLIKIIKKHFVCFNVKLWTKTMYVESKAVRFKNNLREGLKARFRNEIKCLFV